MNEPRNPPRGSGRAGRAERAAWAAYTLAKHAHRVVWFYETGGKGPLPSDIAVALTEAWLELRRATDYPKGES
jgi:hypothetical protein